MGNWWIAVNLIAGTVFVLMQAIGVQCRDRGRMLTWFMVAAALSWLLNIPFLFTAREPAFIVFTTWMGVVGSSAYVLFLAMLLHGEMKRREISRRILVVLAFIAILPFIGNIVWVFAIERVAFGGFGVWPVILINNVFPLLTFPFMLYGLWHEDRFVSRCYMLPHFFVHALVAVWMWGILRNWESVVLAVSCVVAIVRFVPRKERG